MERMIDYDDDYFHLHHHPRPPPLNIVPFRTDDPVVPEISFEADHNVPGIPTPGENGVGEK